MLFVSVLALSVSHSFDSSPKGGALGKTENFAVLPRLSLWERWHGVSRDGEGKPASKRQIYEKALVFQGENLERREPVKFKLQGTRGTTLFAAPLGTAALHDRLFAANRCPCNGGHPSEPTCVFSCRSGASNRNPLHPPCTTRRLSVRRRKSFFPRQRICAFFKVD